MGDVSGRDCGLEVAACGDCCVGDIAGEVGDGCGGGDCGGGEAGMRVVGGTGTSFWSGSSHFKLMCVLL